MTNYYISPRRVMAQRQAAMTNAKRPDVHIPVDVVLEGDDFVITAWLPGIAAGDVQIEVIENVVSISGEFAQEEAEEVKYLLREGPRGKFNRSLRLPTVLNASSAEAEVVDGILKLRVPKAEEAKARQIKVKSK